MNPPGTFDDVIACSLADLSDLTDRFQQWGRQHAMPKRTIWVICIVLDEIISNIIGHGFPHGGNAQIAVTIRAGDAVIDVTVKDQAPPFNPFAEPAADVDLPIDDRDAGGLGIHFVRGLVRTAAYRYDGTTNIVSLMLDRSSDATVSDALTP